MKTPALRDDAFLADVAASAGGTRLWWLGQSGFLVRHRGRHLLIDPYLSDSLTTKYAATDKPHTRIAARVIDPARLDFIDIVTSSHNHTDHLDADTLLPLRRTNPSLAMVLPEANRHFAAARLACDPAWFTGLDDGAHTTVAGIGFHAVASAHETVDRDPDGRCLYLGYVIDLDGFRIYHSGDCVLYDGLAEKLAPFHVNLALLPINGTLPERRVTGNFWGREAAWLAHAIGARLAIPMHYDLFEFNTETPDEFADHCRRLGQRYHLLQNGEGITL